MIGGVAGRAPLMTQSLDHPDSLPADWLNRECFCVGADLPALRQWLRDDLATRGYDWRVVESHPHLFSELPVFVAREHVVRMQHVVAAVESVVANPAYRAAVLADAPPIAQLDPGPLGVFFGYDFHLGDDGPKLIEINTNAGGALLNVELGRAQRACCEAVRRLLASPVEHARVEADIVAMFHEEWRLARGTAPLECIAIVDESPEQQYLYPEFLLFQRLFEAHGSAALVADAAALEWDGQSLRAQGRRIDLVYNRLTDFYLEQPAQAALRSAFRAGAVVLTPHPRAHALYASKRNLAVLTDADRLTTFGVPPATIATLLGSIPRTQGVDAADADHWWARRKELFFKPTAGFGSRGSYRGDKVTRKVFADILAGDYVAQALVPPSERLARDGDAPRALKLDLRNYVYGGRVQLVAARLYQGQTTNFRTPGGGFAPVFQPPG
jgi:hypothetical protein